MSACTNDQTKYILIKTIHAKFLDDEAKPSTIDITVLSQTDQDVIVVVDFSNKALKAYWTDSRVKRNMTSCLQFKRYPRRVANISEDQIVVTFWNEPIVAVVNVVPNLRLAKIIETDSKQCGISVLQPLLRKENYRFVFGSHKCISVNDSDGCEVKTISVNDSDLRPFPAPWYMTTSTDGNILVSDFEKGGLTCLSPEGNVIWFYKSEGISRGVTCDSDGFIYLAEGETNQVTLLTPGGEFVNSLLWEDTKPSCVYGIALDKNGKLYLSDYHGYIRIFKPIKKTGIDKIFVEL